MSQIQITATPTVGIAPMTVAFEVVVLSGEWVSFVWEFGDGNTSTERNPTHVYSTDGYHTVELTAYASSGSSVSVVEPALVRVGKLSFSVEYDSEGTPPVSAYFTNTSIAPTGYEYVDWDWTFGDASLGSGATGPSHVYGEYGSYNASLTAKMRKS